MFDAPLALALPDGQAPGFNDNDGGNVKAAAPLYTSLPTPAGGGLNTGD